MLELEEALARVLDNLPSPPPERVAIDVAAGRVVSEPVHATVDLPRFDNSSMDGYGVRAADTCGAKPEQPVTLRQIGRVPAGASFPGTVSQGECVRLFTGSPLPAGADAVVMQEDTQSSPSRSAEIQILEPAQPGENVRSRGEDVRSGTLVLNRGEVINAARLSLLAAAGVDQVSVGPRPKVAVLATGSELRQPGQTLGPGQIYESNRLVLAALLEQAGASPTVLPLVPDSLEATRAAMAAAFRTCDIVVSCGGVSVGEMDFVKDAFESLGGELNFWKVAIKPGKPFVFGKHASKFLFGLPGNPVSTVVTFLLLVRPAIRRWQGAADLSLPVVQGVTAEPLKNPGDRRHFLRVQLDHSGAVRSAGPQASHVLSSLAAANALAEVPPHTTFNTGTAVKALLFP